MHVLITADTVGGVWTYARELVTGLVRHGVRVTLVGFGQIPAPDQVAWLEALEGVDFRPTGFRLEWMQDAEQEFELSTEYLLSVVRETRPDVIHLNQYGYGSMPVSMPKLVVAHSDVVSWWVAVNGEPPTETKWSCWYRDTVRRGLLGAAAVVAPSQWMLDAVCLHYGSPANGRVIYNGRTPVLFLPDVSKEGYAVSAGRLWDGGKQVSLLTRMNPPLPVHIAGSDEHPDSSLRGSSRPSPNSRIQFHGRLTEAQMRQLYSRAANYSGTSQYEPFGLAPLEAALSRCALVLNDIPSFRELWGDQACYFHHNDAQSLADVLAWLARDRQSCITYGNLAYQHARQRFTADRMAGEYLGLYHSLVCTEVEAA